jgi:hypothetical protein
LEAIDFVAGDGRPTLAGYQFVDACERTENPNSELPLAMYRKALLVEGDYLALLHYVYRLSEERFGENSMAFAIERGRTWVLDRGEYLMWIRAQLVEKLKVMNTAAERGGVARKEFQGELATLRKLGMVGKFRIGVGLVIDWPKIHEALEFSM